MRLINAIALGIWVSAILAACGAQSPPTPTRWSQPAADLCGQVADILGPGQAQLTVRNLSTIQASDIPAIRKLLEQDLKAHGVLVSGTESANAVRVTLSQNARERLWIAEVVEGSATHIAMVHVDAAIAPMSATIAPMVLRKERVSGIVGTAWEDPILAAAEINGHFVVLFADRISIFSARGGARAEQNTFVLEKPLGRDPRGILQASSDGGRFTAYAPGTECTGTYSLPLTGATGDSGWSVRCRPSDDPWPVYQSADAGGVSSLRAFYNPARDFFTGITTPGIGVDLPAFYSAAIVPRAAGGAALLSAETDGKVQLAETGTLRSVAGTRDWGSDFGVVRTGCGAGTQIIASSSGGDAGDSLRAFEIPALEAIPASAPLAIDGTVTAMWAAQDGKSLLIAVRDPTGEYEVDRVTALCN